MAAIYETPEKVLVSAEAFWKDSIEAYKGNYPDILHLENMKTIYKAGFCAGVAYQSQREFEAEQLIKNINAIER